jgi:hypothetical protein
MMTTPEGGGVHRRRFWQRFPPPISNGSGLLTLYLCVSDLRNHSLDETLVVYIGVLGQNKLVRERLRRIGRTRRKIAQVARPRWGAPPGLIPYILTTWCPTLSHFGRLEIFESWPLTLPFFESRSS